jgi:hypothetical protein
MLDSGQVLPEAVQQDTAADTVGTADLEGSRLILPTRCTDDEVCPHLLAGRSEH